jgi:ER membrane protein complex subunit 7
MRLTFSALLSALAAGAAAASSSAAIDKNTVSLTLAVPPSQHLPNPHILPAATHATLTALGEPRRAAPLTVANTFVFHNVTPGSYLADVHSAAYGFAPLRVDVLEPATTTAAGPVIKVWETYRGNEWGNKGEEVLNAGGVGAGTGKVAASGGPSYAVRCLGKKVFFQERGKCESFCLFLYLLLKISISRSFHTRETVFANHVTILVSILTILKNPMILMGLASMGIFFGMPKLVENSECLPLPPP